MLKHCFLIAVLVFACTIAQGQSYKEINLSCPVCAQKIIGHAHSHSVEKLEQDRDLFKYYNGLPYYGSQVSLCTNCGYAGYNRGFNRPITNSQKDLIKQTLGPSIRQRTKKIASRNKKYGIEGIDQDELGSFLKYSHLEEVYKIIEVQDVVMGKLYLEMSWNARQRIVMPLVLRETNAALVGLNQHLTDAVGMQKIKNLNDWIKRYEGVVKKIKERKIKYCAYYILASLYDRHGDYKTAMQYIRRAELTTDNPRLKKIVQANGRLIDKSRVYQRLAIKHFRKALKVGEVNKMEVPLIVYLTAELYRRLGEGTRAQIWFKAVRELPNAPLVLTKWSKEQYGLINQMPSDSPEDTSLLSIVLNEISTEDSASVKHKLQVLDTRLLVLKTRIMLFLTQLETYPDKLDDLVRLGYIKKREDLACPITGNPFLYAKPLKRDGKPVIMLSLAKSLPIAYGVRMVSIMSDGEITKQHHNR